eukprot:1041226_1
MSLTLYYPDGSPLSIIPPNAIKITHDRHSKTVPNCSCPQCEKYKTNPVFYDEILKEYTPQAIAEKKKRFREKWIKSKYGSVENYKAEQHRALELARAICEARDSDADDSLITPEFLVEHTDIALLQRMVDGLVKQKRNKKSLKVMKCIQIIIRIQIPKINRNQKKERGIALMRTM